MVPLLQTTECPWWEYKDVSGHDEVLLERTVALLTRLRMGRVEHRAAITDTRPIHRQMFVGLTPTCCPYYAGHYRGESYLCLRDRAVQVGGAPSVGLDARHVFSSMSALGRELLATLGVLDAVHRLPEAQYPQVEKTVNTVVVCARTLELFFRIVQAW